MADKPSKDDVLRMAKSLDGLDKWLNQMGGFIDTLSEAAAMLRAYAEVVEVDAAMINRAREAYRIRLNQHVAASFDGDALQDAMRAALTAALSTRGG